jgi:hypothetical protein
LIAAAAMLVVAIAAGSGWYFTRSTPPATPTSVAELHALLIRDGASGDAKVRTYSLEQWAGRPEVQPGARDAERDKLRSDGFRWHVEMSWDTADSGRRRVELTQYKTPAQAADQVEAFRLGLQEQLVAEALAGQPKAYLLDQRDPALRGLDYVHAIGARGTIMVLVSAQGTGSAEDVRSLLVDQMDRLPAN